MTTTKAEPEEITEEEIRGGDFQHVPVGGRLFKFRATWKGATNESIITKGLSWSWLDRPPPAKRIRQKTSPKMDAQIIKLRKMRVIEKTSSLKWQSILFMVPKKDSTEERLIIDLAKLNEYIKRPKFKMLTMAQIRLLLPKNFWTVSVDLKDGYFHIPITPRKRPYLGFRYRGQNWRFRALPFGLNIGPRVFTKLIAHIVKVLGTKGIWCLPYLDDLLIIAATQEECHHHAQVTISTLKSFGWIINEKKSRLKPAQAFEWLGAKFDLRSHTVAATMDKTEELRQRITSVVTSRSCSKRIIMQFQGLANWIGQFHPTIRALLSRTKNLLRVFKRRHLDAPIRLNKGMKLGLVRWLTIPTIPVALGHPRATIIIQSDASEKGWGFEINGIPFSGQFDETMNYPIHTLELLAVWFALLKVTERGAAIQVLCDNSNAVTAVRRCTSTVYHLTMISELIWKRATALGWVLTMSHIQGKFNVLADQLSRNVTLSTEWSLSREDFEKFILKENRRLRIDLFATKLNNKLKKFVSPCPDKMAHKVDAMAISWDKWKHLYLYPPTTLISKVLAKLTETNFKTAILITPETPIRPWYMALQLRNIPSKVISVRLQQIVKDRLEIAPTCTKLRVWILSKKHMDNNTQDVHKH